MSETKSIYEALLEVQKKIGKVKKNKVNPHFGKSYADYGAVLDAVLDPLNEVGILLSHHVLIENGNTFLQTTLRLGNETIVSNFPMTIDGNPQHTGSMISYAKRYNLAALTGIAAEDDDDGNAASAPPKAQGVAQPEKDLKSPTKAVSAPRELKSTADVKAASMGSNWREKTIHFGKHKGKPLGELPHKSLYWFYSEWMPSKKADQKFKPKQDDINLMAALNQWHDEVHKPTEEELANQEWTGDEPDWSPDETEVTGRRSDSSKDF